MDAPAKVSDGGFCQIGSHILSAHGAKYKTTSSVAFFKFPLNLTGWRERIFNLCPWGIELRRICVISVGLKSQV